MDENYSGGTCGKQKVCWTFLPAKHECVAILEFVQIADLRYNIKKYSFPMTVAAPITITNGHQLYDLMMMQIEPELMVENISLLTSKYRNETEEQKKTRLDRYQKAFAEYDRQMTAFVAAMNTQVAALKRSALASAENKERSREEEDTRRVEFLMQS